MSNWLRVHRVRVQEIDEKGNPVGEPDYGVMAMDDYEQGYDVSYATLEELNAAIEEEGCILDVVGGFDNVSREQITTENFSGNPGTVEHEDEDDEDFDDE